MDAMEFRITSGLSPIQSATLTANFDETERWLQKAIAPYTTMIVTEDGISAAKADRAKINKVKTRIDEVRKEAKRACLAVYKPFEEQCRRLLEICDTGADNIDGQVKRFEEEEKRKKQQKIQAYFETHIGEASRWLKLDAIYNPRWENKTYPIDDIIGEIDLAIKKTLDEVAAIRAMQSEFEPALLDEYVQTRSVAAVLAKQVRLTGQKRDLEEMALRHAKETVERGEREQKPAPDKTADSLFADDSEVLERDFRVYATKAQLAELREFLVSHGIRYAKVPK